MDNRVKEYINKQGLENKKIIEKLRRIILNNFPKIFETTMSEGLWYEGKFYITCFRDHVNLGVNIQGLSNDEANLFKGTGKTMRHLKFYSSGEIMKKELLVLMNLVYNKSRCDCKIHWKN